MKFCSQHLFLDQFTPVSIYQKIEDIFPGEVKFLFESSVNTNDGNFSYIIIGARERIVHKDGKSFHIDENGLNKEIQSNPFLFLKDYYKKLDMNILNHYQKN